ncbi:MAG: sigma-70 family RNA polymerase sigma factor [Candidatus Omnitrophica bacterium]|nr:sigma-70 family RNA polymerase sigma factor [Candidatus Omnitrophota bacterium]
METDELIRKCLEKDSGAWDEFVRKYQSLVHRSVNYKLRALNVRTGACEFKDIAQDIFLKIWESQKLRDIKDIKCLPSWLAIVSINFTANYCRTKRFGIINKAVSFDDEIDIKGSTVRLSSIIPDKQRNINSFIENKELLEIMKKEINSFSLKKQLVLKFHLYENKKHKEISRVMNLPRNTVTTMINRAKGQLSERLNGYLKESGKDKELLERI